MAFIVFNVEPVIRNVLFFLFAYYDRKTNAPPARIHQDDQKIPLEPVLVWSMRYHHLFNLIANMNFLVETLFTFFPTKRLNICKSPPPSTISLYIAFLVAALGFAFRHWAIITLKSFFTMTLRIRKDHYLITSGPYRWLIHPSYMGYLTYNFAMPWVVMRPGGAFDCLLGGSTWLKFFLRFGWTVWAPVFFFWNRIPKEEALMHEQFGNVWVEYANQRWRIVPGIY